MGNRGPCAQMLMHRAILGENLQGLFTLVRLQGLANQLNVTVDMCEKMWHTAATGCIEGDVVLPYCLPLPHQDAMERNQTTLPQHHEYPLHGVDVSVVRSDDV